MENVGKSHMQEELSLKELVLILLKGWKLIVGATILTVITTIVALTVLNSTSYTGELKGRLIKIDQYDTIYGSYRPTFLNIEEQIKQSLHVGLLELVQKEAKNSKLPSVMVSAPDGINFTIQYNSNSTEYIEPVLKSLQKHLEDYLNYDLQTQAVDALQKYHDDEIIREQTNVKVHQAFIDRFIEKLDQTEKLLGSDINPAYDMFLREITQYEIKQTGSQIRIEMLESNINMLNLYNYEDFNTYKKGNEHLDAISVNLTLSNEINKTHITRFNTPLMIVVGAVMGAMLGVFIVFFNNYWKSN